MPKTKISEFSSTPANNTDIDSINIAENCPPSGINDAIRELMAQLKDFQTGAVGDSFNGPVGTTTAAAGAFTTLSASSTVILSGGTANGVAYLNGSKVVTSGSALTFDGTSLGVGTTSPASLVAVAGSTSTTLGLSISAGGWNNARHRLTVPSSGDESVWSWNYTGSAIDSSSYGTASIGLTSNAIKFATATTNTAPSEQMRLTSTGLGIGTSSPAYKLDVVGTIQATGSGGAKVRLTDNTVSLLNSSATASGYLSFKRADGTQKAAIGSYYNIADEGNLEFISTGTTNMVLNSSGNLGLGVTPSAWYSNTKVLQLNYGAFGTQAVSGSTTMFNNAYESSNDVYNYLTTNGAARYTQTLGVHKWYIAPSGTAGNAITFTQAATITAGGDYHIARTTTADTTVGASLFANGTITCARSASDNANLNLYVYSTGAGAARFYVGMGGTVYATSTTITAISDQRLKENIRDLDEGLATVMALKPRKFDWKEGKGKGISNDRGFIAQEFEQVLPDMIEKWADPAPEGEDPYKAINANLIPTLVKAIQELKMEFDAYKAAHP